MDELKSDLSKLKSKKAPGLDNIPPEVWKYCNFDNILLGFCNNVYKGNSIDKWTEGCILPFPKKGDLGVTDNYMRYNTYSNSCKNIDRKRVV